MRKAEGGGREAAGMGQRMQARSSQIGDGRSPRPRWRWCDDENRSRGPALPQRRCHRRRALHACACALPCAPGSALWSHHAPSGLPCPALPCLIPLPCPLSPLFFPCLSFSFLFFLLMLFLLFIVLLDALLVTLSSITFLVYFEN